MPLNGFTLRTMDENLDLNTLRDSWGKWWDGTLERPLVLYERIDPDWSGKIRNQHRQSGGGSIPSLTFAGQFGLDTPIEQVINYFQDFYAHMMYFGDAIPGFWPNFGPGLVAAFLGADYQIQMDTIWMFPPKSDKGVSYEDIPLREISFSFNPNNPLWQRIYDLTKAAVSQLDNRISVGITDLGGNLDILASLVGSTRLAMEVLDNPDEVERLCCEIRAAWLTCYDLLSELVDVENRGSSCWAAVWSPERYYMFQSDFAYMISPGMFKRFVIPDLQICSKTIPNSFYHLDGKGQICHVDHLLALQELRGIQWIPGDGAPPPEDWLPLLSKIVSAGKLCQVYVTAEGARRIVEELGGKGFVLCISDNLSHIDAEILIKELTGV